MFTHNVNSNTVNDNYHLAKTSAIKIQSLVGKDDAAKVCRQAINASLNMNGELSYKELVFNLGIALMKTYQTHDFERYTGLKNIAHYDQRNTQNKAQIVAELCQTYGFENVAKVKARFPHLWKPSCICVDLINFNPNPIVNPDCPLHGKIK